MTITKSRNTQRVKTAKCTLNIYAFYPLLVYVLRFLPIAVSVAVRSDGNWGKVAVSWRKILAANPNPNPTILSHETATLPEVGT